MAFRQRLEVHVRRTERRLAVRAQLKRPRAAATRKRRLPRRPVPGQRKRGPHALPAKRLGRDWNRQGRLLADKIVARIEPVVAERELETLAVDAAFNLETARQARREVPRHALAVRDEPFVADAADLQDLALRLRPRVRLAHKQRARHAVKRAVPAPAAEIAGEGLHEQMVGDSLVTEVLLVDDGSTDNSGHIVDKYASDYDNIYAFHKVNEGQCVARNFALSHVKGEYIHFMDSDDLIKYDAYEKLYAFAKKGNYDVVTFNYLRFDEEKTWKVANQQDVFDEFDGDIENTNLSEFKELCWDMTNCNKIVKKELLDTKNISYHHKNILYEDNLLWIEIYFNAERIGILKEYLYFWRYRNDLTSTTQTYDLDLGNKLFEMVYLVNEFLKENITDKSILYKKYEKLLTINLYFFIVAIQSYPKEHQESLLENAYDMANIVPSDIYTNLNTVKRIFN